MNQIEKIIDIATWNRREHYGHFSAFDDPLLGATAQIDYTRAYQEVKTKGISFSLLALHRITAAVAAVEELRYHTEGDKVVCYDSLLSEATISRDDYTSSFATFGYDSGEPVFIHRAKVEMERLQTTMGFNKGGIFHPNVIHYSAVLWLSFTDMKHLINMRSGDGVPKIFIGKYFRDGEGLMTPVSVTCRHGLMDGYHVAQFIEKLHL